MTNVFNMLDHLLANTIYTVIQTCEPKGQWNMISSAGEAEHFFCFVSQLENLICFS